MAVYVGNGRTGPGLRRRWLGSSLALTLAAWQLLSPAAALAQDGTISPEPAPTVEAASATATTWYVDGSKGADGKCTSTASPCRTIQAAVDQAATGDTILVAGSPTGIAYTFSGASTCTNELGANAVVCITDKKLILRGGFASGNFSTYTPSQNLTIIDGQGRNRGVAVQGYGSPGDTLLDMAGFTVRGGYGSFISKRGSSSPSFAFGGGMRAESIAGLILRDMVFDSNRAVATDRGTSVGDTAGGGGLYVGNAPASLTNVLFINNLAEGGPASTRGGYGQGGGIIGSKTTFVGSGIVFKGNIARAGSTSGVGVTSDTQREDGHGGGAAFYNGSEVSFSDVIARNNQALGGNASSEAGGAFGGALYGESVTLNIAGAEISGNLAQGGNAASSFLGSGGGIMTINSTLNVDRARVVANTAQGGNGRTGLAGGPNGGGITTSWSPGARGSSFRLTNSIVAANKAASGGGDRIQGGGGGGLWIQATDATLEHVTIANNSIAGNGIVGQAMIVINTLDRGSTTTIRNSLITGHSGKDGSAVEVFPKSTVTFAGGLFYANTWNTSPDNPWMGTNVGTVKGTETMGTADPIYVAPSTSDGDFHITAKSPARGKAAGSQQKVDIDNDGRDVNPDYGADEYVNREPQGLPSGKTLLFMPRITN